MFDRMVMRPTGSPCGLAMHYFRLPVKCRDRAARARRPRTRTAAISAGAWLNRVRSRRSRDGSERGGASRPLTRRDHCGPDMLAASKHIPWRRHHRDGRQQRLFEVLAGRSVVGHRVVGLAPRESSAASMRATGWTRMGHVPPEGASGAPRTARYPEIADRSARTA
jgi:hypothetical protein